MADGPASADARSADERARAVAEARWHMAAAVVAAIVLTALMPDDVRLGPNWLLPAVEAVLLVALIDDLIHGGPETNSASDLLEAGSIVWASNNIAFALLYWDLDGGGAAARALDSPRRIDLAFPQEINPGLASPDWRPRFIDYFYLGFTNATAFSPTDVMPLAPWAKLAMTLQAVISLGILGLVIARAVNVFS